MTESVEGTAPGEISVLVIGFSVTEERTGYVKVLSELATARNTPFRIDSRGIGGETMRVLPFMFDSIVTRRYDYVVFEVATSRRFFPTRERYMKLLAELVQCCRRNGAIPMFVNLYHDDFDYSNDMLHDVIGEFCRLFSYPFLSLIDEFAAAKAAGELKSYLKDAVHPNEAGALLVAERILDFLAAAEKNRIGWDHPGMLPAHTLVEGALGRLYSRGHISLPVLDIGENETVVLKLPPQTYVSGLLYLISPLGGEFTITSQGLPRQLKVMAYDAFAYYTRYNCSLFAPFLTPELEIFVNPGRPDIALKKGDIDDGPRVVSLAGVFTNTWAAKYFR